MTFKPGDKICVWGTRYDGWWGTVVQTYSSCRASKVTIRNGNNVSKIAVLKDTYIFPELPFVDSCSTPFISNVDRSMLETQLFAQSLGFGHLFPYAASFN